MSFASRVAGWCLAALTLLVSCTTVQPGDDPARIRDTIGELEERVTRNPEDAGALSDLGILHLRADNVPRAASLLERAHALDAEAPQTLYFLGVTREKQGRTRDALALYQHYPQVSRQSPFRQMMQGRYDFLVRQQARREIKRLIAREDSLQNAADELSPDVIAVFPLAYRGSDSRYAPLGRGLAEMILVDLAQVQRLRVVERVRLQAILNELELARSEYVNSETAPRAGRLLRAGRITGGSYDVLADENLRVDAQLWSALDQELIQLEEQTGGLDAFFRLEKALLFELLRTLGIELTPGEQEQIERVPTQSLQAFLAYSRGLEEEDAGNYRAARDYFEQAAQLDPEFQEAGTKADEMQGLTTAGGPTEAALQAGVQVLPPLTPSVNLVEDRIRNLNVGMGTSATPSTGERQPAEEGVAGTPSLPDPPGPPRSGGN